MHIVQICADIMHKRFQSNREWWYPQLDVENTLIGRNPNEPQSVTLKKGNNTNDKVITQTQSSKTPEINEITEIKHDDDNPSLINGNNENNDNDDSQNLESKEENKENDLTENEVLAIRGKNKNEPRISANTQFLDDAWKEEVEEMEKEDRMNDLESVRLSVNARLVQSQKASQGGETPQSTAL